MQEIDFHCEQPLITGIGEQLHQAVVVNHPIPDGCTREKIPLVGGDAFLRSQVFDVGGVQVKVAKVSERIVEQEAA